jgi:hypothetical protein
LQKVLRAALDAGADVEQYGGTGGRRYRRRQRRPIRAGQHAERGMRRHHGGAGVSRAEQRRRLPARHGLGGDPDGGARLAPQRGRRRLLHRHHLRSLEEADAAPIEAGMTAQFIVDLPSRADEHDAEVGVAHRVQCAFDQVPRGVVAAHRVNSDPDHRSQCSGFKVPGSEFVPGSGFGVRGLPREARNEP